jgi:hypothetical protein
VSASLRAHIRSNVVGYIALFCFVIGGSAIAAKQNHRKAAKNSVVSKSIKDGAVNGKDLAADAVSGPKIADHTITGDDFATDSVLRVGEGFTGYAAISAQGFATGLGHDGTTLDYSGVSVSDGQSGQEAALGLNGFHLETLFGSATYGEQITMKESNTAPPPADRVTIFVRDEGGVTQLVAQFADGTVTVLGEEGP